MNELFFELIRVAIGNAVCLSHTPTAKEWQMLYEMAKKQSLVGICFAGVQKTITNHPSSIVNLSESLRLQWMGMAAKIQQRNEVLNRQCVELGESLKVKGYRCCVLKGQGVASLYAINDERLKINDLSLLRLSGDIDLWVDAPKEEVVELARKTGSKDKASYLHIGANFYHDTDVELHYRPTYMRSLWHNKRMQAFCELHKHDWIDRDGVVVPSYEFNVVYLLSHIYRHLFGMGIGMRQIMDYYFVLVAYAERELPQMTHEFDVNSILKSLGLYEFAGAVMYVLQEVFGLEREHMLCEPDEWRGKALLECVMESGNFGKGQKQMPTWLRKMKQWSKLVVMYPNETLSDPVWRLYKSVCD